MDKYVDKLIVETKVKRREDGVVIEFRYEDESVEEFYFSPTEAKDIVERLNTAIEQYVSATENERG